jgi:hypothetical protein
VQIDDRKLGRVEIPVGSGNGFGEDIYMYEGDTC